MIEFNKLKNLLQKHIVEVSFTSLKSGKQYSIPCTLRSDVVPMQINQSDSDSILLYRLDTNRWEDLRLSTIEGYKDPF
jgi:hypothetical protein